MIIQFKQMNRSLDTETIMQRLNAGADDIVYIGGSLVDGTVNPLSEGMGNESSDVDVFVIKGGLDFGDSESEYTESIKKTFFIDSKEFSFDVIIYNRDEIDKLLSSIENANISKDCRVVNMIDWPEGWDMTSINSFLTRYRASMCIYGEENYQRFISSKIYDTFIQVYKRYILTRLDGLTQDVYGNLANTEYETALLMARSCAIKYMKYILYAENEMCDRDKWIWLKFSNLVQMRKNYQDEYANVRRILFDGFSGGRQATDMFMGAMEDTIEDMQMEIDL